MNIKDRILEFIKYKNIPVREFERNVGLSNGYISRFKGNIGNEKLNNLLQAYPDINKVWLLTGEGEMILDMGGFEEVPDEEIVNLNPKPGDKYTLVPLLNIDSVGGMDSDNDLTWAEQYAIRHIPFIDARQDDIAIFQSGDSMTPGIPAGSILQIRQVHDWEQYFGYGDTFVLWLKDDRRITKQVLRYREDPQNYVICHSFNPEYADEELPKKFIRQVWKVISVLSGKGW